MAHMVDKKNFLLHRQRLIIALAVTVFLITTLVLGGGGLNHWLQYWWMAPTAFLIALVANTAGISGAALFVPFFILVFPALGGMHLSAVDTVKLGLVTESFGLSSSALAFISFGLVDIEMFKHNLSWALPFVITGAVVTTFIPEAILYLIIAILMIISALLLRYGKDIARRRRKEHVEAVVSYPQAHSGDVKRLKKDNSGKVYRYCITQSGQTKRQISYGIGGFFQGAAGFGIGELGVISLILTKIPVRIAIGTSHLVVAVAAILASIIHFGFASGTTASAGFPWNILIMTVPAVVLGGQASPYLTTKISAKHLQLFVTSLFLVIAVALIVLVIS